MPSSPARPVAVEAWRWAGAALFAASLGYFLFTYALTLGGVTTGPFALRDAVWNFGLFTVFAMHHSVFARKLVREAVARTVPPGLERSFYVTVASLLFIGVCAAWQPLPGALWSVNGPGAWPFYAAQAWGAWLTLRSAGLIDVRELAGLKPAADVSSGATEFRTSGPYGWVRHPIYAGWFLIVFGVPVMTMTRLEFAVVSGLYILVAIPFEERTLSAAAGAPYARYTKRVKWRLVPGIY